MSADLLRAALAYAGRGWPVLALAPGGKVPACEHGVKDATTDPAPIREWWGRWPRANVGLACGELVAVDLDCKNGADGRITWQAICARHGIDATGTVISLTPSGGRHLVYAAAGRQARNSAGRLGPGVDVRGRGGYIVAPPSRLSDGRTWRWDPAHHPYHVAIAPLPAALAALLADPAPPGTTSGLAAPVNGTAYARAAVANELGQVRRATIGERNHRLNRAAFNLGQLAGAGLLDLAGIEAGLLAAAVAVGLGEREALRTIASGLAAGGRSPRLRDARP